MRGGGGADEPSSPSLFPPRLSQPINNEGEFLLRLVQSHRQQPPPPHPHHHTASQSRHNLSLDPAVTAVGPSIPIPLPSNRHHHDPRPSLSPFSFSPQNPNFSVQRSPQNPPWPRHQSPPPHTPSFFPAPHQHFDLFRQQQQQRQEPDKVLFGNIPFPETNTTTSNRENLSLQLELDSEIKNERELGLGLGTGEHNGFNPNRRIDQRVNWAHGSPEQRRPGGPPPGFPGKPANQRRSFCELRNVGREVSSSSTEFNNHRDFRFSSKDHSRERKLLSRDNGIGLGRQLDHRGLPTGSALHSMSASDVEESLLNSRGQMVDNGVSQDIVDDLSEQLVDSMLGEDEPNEKTETSTKKKHHRDKDFRLDARGKWILSQRMRNSRRLIGCPRGIVGLNTPFLAIYESLIPVEEEKAKQKQLLTLLEKLVCKEWPNARLYVYGSCANSFGFSKSDIDVCIAMDDQDINKSEVLLKLADILQSDNLQNVQALTRARVPIVKLMDPVTGISCDICINNVLAVVNTKLLRDYAEIDVRLRQLAFLVKHWAKSRGVNETYHGTLSSYAYVLMCIHFLQQRNPPILPCLQGMEATYAVTVDDIECAYFDQVEKLGDFGARNRESIAQLVWEFFGYWAYSHDYSNSVISIRTGSTLSKQEKDWTRRIGNDRHLICIEDPFETSHDLGRVVDKHSIRVLREEFERAADIMQYNPNPCVALFEPYIPS